MDTNGYQEKYAFDDGAIWYIETDEQVDDNDEIVRVASNNIFINEHNLLKFASLLNVQGFNQDTLNFIKSDNNTLKATCQQMNNKLINYIMLKLYTNIYKYKQKYIILFNTLNFKNKI